MVAAIGAAGAVAGGAISAGGARSAANSQQDSAAAGMDFQMVSQYLNGMNQTPFIANGQSASNQLQQRLSNGTLGGSFTGQDYLNNADPGYQFQLQQGQQALQNSQAAGSGVLSGAALKGLIGYNQGVASTGYQNAYNRWLSSQQNTYNQLSGMAGVGEQAAAAFGGVGVQAANGVANSMAGYGNAGAAGAVGQANAANQAISNGTGYYALNQMMGSGGGGGGYDSGFNGQNNPANQAGLTNLMNSY